MRLGCRLGMGLRIEPLFIVSKRFSRAIILRLQRLKQRHQAIVALPLKVTDGLPMRLIIRLRTDGVEQFWRQIDPIDRSHETRGRIVSRTAAENPLL